MTEREPNMITADAVENTVENEDTFSDHEPGVEFSDRFKKRMNRLFREQVDTKRAMYPEVDSRYERVRSRLIRAKLITEHKLKKTFKRGNPT